MDDDDNHYESCKKKKSTLNEKYLGEYLLLYIMNYDFLETDSIYMYMYMVDVSASSCSVKDVFFQQNS